MSAVKCATLLQSLSLILDVKIWTFHVRLYSVCARAHQLSGNRARQIEPILVPVPNVADIHLMDDLALSSMFSVRQKTCWLSLVSGPEGCLEVGT